MQGQTKNSLPKNTLLKLVAIVIIGCGVYQFNKPAIQRIWQDPQLSKVEASVRIMKQLLGVSDPTTKREASSSLQLPSGNQQPHTASPEVQALETYQKAQTVANAFNQKIDIERLNELVVNEINVQRQQKQWEPLQVGYHLMAGTQHRAQELGQFHYLTSQTVEGSDFRADFPEVWSAESRLGESTFELYMSVEDVHIETWQQHMDVLAAYLVKSFDGVIKSEISAGYRSQYISVHVEPSSVQAQQIPYVRVVAVLTSDTVAEQ